jgi:predicted N-formylglutamate amidohydrolase
MQRTERTEDFGAGEDSPPVERIVGDVGSGLLLLCDHASNAIPRVYGDLGLRAEALARHIAYDIGAAVVTRGLAKRLNAPALLTTFSRLLIDPNRGAEDPTLVMRYSDGAIVPGNARADAAEIEHRRETYWLPYRKAIMAEIAAMREAGKAPAILSVHSFTPIWRGRLRPWKFGALWDKDPRLPKALLGGVADVFGYAATELGDNEPYDGALYGDTIDACATPLGLSNALIEIRQDLIDTAVKADAWAERFAEVLRPILRDEGVCAPADFGSRADGNVRKP